MQNCDNIIYNNIVAEVNGYILCIVIVRWNTEWLSVSMKVLKIFLVSV